MTEASERARYDALGQERANRIRTALHHALAAEQVDIRDRSWSHRKHAGARDGRGHFELRVVSERFAGLSRLGRHRLVYEAVGDLMSTDIHALNIEALTPDEITSSPGKRT